MDLAALKNAAANSAAIVYRINYQPTGGEGAKVYPSSFLTSQQEGSEPTYAKEERFIDGQTVPCVIVDSVPSQANRFEEILAEAKATNTLKFPTISVDLTCFQKGVVSTLQLPHRIADAYFNFADLDKMPWPKTEIYKAISTAGPRESTEVFRYDPVSLLFGFWMSHDRSATARFGRQLTSELVAINAKTGIKTASRLDPLRMDTQIEIDKDVVEATGIDANKYEIGELGFGNIPPTLDRMGGVTCDHVLQTSSVTLSGLRRLSFPDSDGNVNPDRDLAGRCVLASLALYCLEASISGGLWLRSGCDLVAESNSRNIVGRNGTDFTFDVDGAKKLFENAVQYAENLDLSFAKDLVLDGDTDGLRKRFSNLEEEAKQKPAKKSSKKSKKKQAGKKKAAKRVGAIK